MPETNDPSVAPRQPFSQFLAQHHRGALDDQLTIALSAPSVEDALAVVAESIADDIAVRTGITPLLVP